MENKKNIIFEELQIHRIGRPITYYVNERGCWICNSHSLDRDGYVHIDRGGKDWLLHRYTYTMTKGEIADGMVIMHICDCPTCCNPAHLVAGTQKQNVQDMYEKKRQAKTRRKVSPEEMEMIAKDPRSACKISKEMNINYHIVRNIKNDSNEKGNKKYKTNDKPHSNTKGGPRKKKSKPKTNKA